MFLSKNFEKETCMYLQWRCLIIRKLYIYLRIVIILHNTVTALLAYYNEWTTWREHPRGWPVQFWETTWPGSTQNIGISSS